jgi:hypothetical protein
VSTTIEHRVSPRETTVNDQTYVQLMEWEGMPIIRGRLLNVSTGGALILVEGVGGPYRPPWVRLERAPEIGWVAADIARFDGPQEVAIRFHSLCPLASWRRHSAARPSGPPTAEKRRPAFEM